MLIGKYARENTIIRKAIDQDGLIIIGIDAEGKRVRYFYTIGLHDKHGLPELLILGNMPEEAGTALLQSIANAMHEHGTMFVDGARFDNGGKFPLLIYNTATITQKRYTLAASHFYGHENYMVQQVILPDENGKYPTDKVCQHPYRVPVLRSTMAIMQGTKARH